jgi:hypothetical protein
MDTAFLRLGSAAHDGAWGRMDVRISNEYMKAENPCWLSARRTVGEQPPPEEHTGIYIAFADVAQQLEWGVASDAVHAQTLLSMTLKKMPDVVGSLTAL